ncbi:MATE family efflux transporter [Erysipelothrix urinaevulpis]|uniref:MATE family efflux transporter n=1 Tax=Erysipelothrix urinaevulpis TaxID=2683717 RepID=UPI001357F1D1|nr:MATE family efflux transporter [Erysipelothrix urinaevulpis]
MNYNKYSDLKLLVRFAIPQMIGLIFNSIYFIIDGMFIGWRLGPDALAAAGVAIPVVEIMIALSMMISVGAGVVISNLYGQKKYSEANQMFNKSNAITLLVSLIIVITGNVFVRDLAQILGATDLIMNDTLIYLRYFITASPFLVFSFTLSTYVRNDGNPKLAMWALIVGSISNIFLDWLFMYPLNWGMSGAALATAIGPVFSVLLLLPHFLMKKGRSHFKWTKFSIQDMITICRNGMAAFITNFSIGLVTFLYNITIVKNHLGETALSSYVIIGYIALIAITAFLGSSQGLQPSMSYFAGEKNYKRIRSLSTLIVMYNLIVALVLTTLLSWKGDFFISLFTNDRMLINETLIISRIYFLNLPFAAINIVLATLFQALNQQRISTVLSLLRSTIPLYLLLYILPLLFGASSIWTAIIGAEALTALVSIALWIKFSNNLETKEL